MTFIYFFDFFYSFTFLLFYIPTFLLFLLFDFFAKAVKVGTVCRSWMCSRGTCVGHDLSRAQRLSDTHVHGIIHVQLVSSVATTQSRFAHQFSNPPNSTCWCPQMLQHIWRDTRGSRLVRRLSKVRGKKVEQNRNPYEVLLAAKRYRSWLWGKVPTGRDAVPRSLWRVFTLPMQPVPCVHAVATQLNVD